MTLTPITILFSIFYQHKSAMPFLRSPKGTKVIFSPAKLSALLSLVYLEAVGDKTPKYRGLIQQHALCIWKELEKTYGSEQDDEWPGPAIHRQIEEELLENATVEVHEAFSSMNINEFQAHKKERTLHPEKENKYNWPQFKARPTRKNSIALVSEDNIDPVWSISHKGLEEESQAKFRPIKNESKDREFLKNIGVPTKNNPPAKPKKDNSSSQFRRSDWIGFWEKLPTSQIPFNTWKKHILSLPPDHLNKSLDEWWVFWQDQIDKCLGLDPKLYELRRAIFERQRRADITSQTWADGSLLGKKLLLDNSTIGNTWYKKLCVEYLRDLFAKNYPEHTWNWSEIKKAITPQRDLILDWKAWQHVDEAGVLLGIENRKWSNGDESSSNCKELPQWAWMRAAMGMCVFQDMSVDERTKNTIEIYNQISLMNLIPASCVVREAGMKNPRFMEDHTWNVPDNFESIQKVIYSSAVETTWTGTSSSLWSKVRSKNAPIKSGRRKSTGVNDFLRTIDSHMKAQGRVGDDKPVTIMLPVWHPDLEEFISLGHEGGQRLRVVLLISDAFMERVAEKGVWNLLDPHVYPEVLDENSYAVAENLIYQRKKSNPTAHKAISAEKLWRLILSQARLGSPFITFHDSNIPFLPKSDNILYGLDGVGAFPTPKSKNKDEGLQKIQWPALAVNINAMISDNGEPLLEKWKDTITWAYWMAEQIYIACDDQLSDSTKEVRPLCLGAVGFFEAIQKAVLGSSYDDDDVSSWLYRISEAWATLNIAVDQMFCKKYGPAKFWENSSDCFHPLKSHEMLTKQRGGGTGMPPLHDEMSDIFNSIKGHRFSVRTVWAPFKHAATLAGVSPGGFGTLFPVEWIMDERRNWRLTPSSILISQIKKQGNDDFYGDVFTYHDQPSQWPEDIKKLCIPDMVEWKKRLKYASIVRPWIEQGVSVTLPAGMQISQLSMLLQQAWWMGVSNIRFEDSFKKPDMGNDPWDGSKVFEKF